MSFAVVTLGRCASTYLAAQLNKSPTWIVEHEPLKYYPAHPKWGSVDPQLINCSKLLAQVPVKGVVLRHPLDIFFSMVRRWAREPRGIEAKDRAFRVVHTVQLLEREIQKGDLHIFKFHEITTDVQAIVDGARALGIEDLDPNTLSVAPINSWKRYAYSLDDLSPALVRSVRTGCDWFAKKYGLPLECEVAHA